MADIRNLLNQIAAQEAQLRNAQFLAPCVRGGRVRTSVAHIIHTFTPQPQDFEGWVCRCAQRDRASADKSKPNCPIACGS